MRKMRWIICLVVIATNVFSAGKYGTAAMHGGKAKMSFHVIDDEGRPVDSAMIRVAFFFDPKKQDLIFGETDTNGFCSVEGLTYTDVSYQIEKDGYYRTDGHYVFGMVDPPVIKNHWQPWNPTNSVILKPIKNPVPMYAKEVEAVIPVLDRHIGFDLEKSDWVSPYGGGARSDFLISFSKDRRAKNDYDLNITLGFLNQEDGIQEIYVENPQASELRMPYEAPLVGYQTNWISHAGQRPESGYFGTLVSDETKNYLYRIRTVSDENGGVKEAYYGKIHGAIHLRSAFRDDPKIIFTYYLNPTPNDRNVEFDSDQNLFGGRDRFAP